MGSIVSLIDDALSCPATTIMSILGIFIFTKQRVGDIDEIMLSLSYKDCILKRQYWRFFTAPFSHNSYIQLFLNMMSLWSIRSIELNLGSIFFVKYSLLMMLTETLLAFGLIRLFQHWVGRNLFAGLYSSGCAGLVMAWLGFQSLEVVKFTVQKNFVLFSFFPIHPTLAPLVMSIVYSMLLPRHYIFFQLTGLTSGYLLAGGLLRFLDEGYYWSLCFILNVALLICSSSLEGSAVLNAATFSSNDTGPGTDIEGQVLEVIVYGDNSNSDNNDDNGSGSEYDIEEGHRGGRRGGREEEEMGGRNGNNSDSDDDDDDDDDDVLEDVPLLDGIINSHTPRSRRSGAATGAGGGGGGGGGNNSSSNDLVRNGSSSSLMRTSSGGGSSSTSNTNNHRDDDLPA